MHKLLSANERDETQIVMRKFYIDVYGLTNSALAWMRMSCHLRTI